MDWRDEMFEERYKDPRLAMIEDAPEMESLRALWPAVVSAAPESDITIRIRMRRLQGMAFLDAWHSADFDLDNLDDWSQPQLEFMLGAVMTAIADQLYGSAMGEVVAADNDDD